MTAPLRPYRPSDQKAVLRIWEAATRQAHPFLSEDFIASERENLTTLYLPRTTTFVVERAGVAGFISVFHGEIGGLFVEPAHQRQGVGRALVVHVLQDGPLTLEVFRQNRAAQAFYAACGFRTAGGRLHEETGHWLLQMRADRLV